MFHHFHRATYSESVRKETHGRFHISTFKWIVAVLSIVLLAAGASSAIVAAHAASPSVDHRPLLKVAPKNVGIPGDGINCKGVLANNTTVCHVTLTELKSSSGPLHWTTRSDLPVAFSPASGNLIPGQSVKVTITTKFCGGYSNFYFVGPKNVATVTFQCG
jgi:hypothetical protein